jgi:hypothetical protein
MTHQPFAQHVPGAALRGSGAGNIASCDLRALASSSPTAKNNQTRLPKGLPSTSSNRHGLTE